MNRRLPLVLSVVAVATLTAGCTTFSDSDNIARVDDVALSSDEFQATLTDLGAPSDERLPADAVRAQITTWIQEQLGTGDGTGVSDDEAAAIYDLGIDSSGTVCINGIVVADEAAATRAVGELEAGADFAELFAAENLDQNLADRAGDVGCITPDQLAQASDLEFVEVAASLSADDPLGTAPLTDDTGAELAWVVLSFRSFAELNEFDAATVRVGIDSAARIADADIFVDPRYGTFDEVTRQVVPLG